MAYNKKIKIQFLSENETDEIGQPVKEWLTLCEPWAELSTLKGREYYAAAQNNTEKHTVFKIRWSRQLADKLTSEIRLIYNGFIYDIDDIRDIDEKHRQFEIRAILLNNNS